PLLGMLSYDKASDIPVKKSDISIAKNYLNEEEMKLLGLLVEQYLAFAETMAQQHTPMYMKDWIERLDVILKMNGRELLNNAGKISHDMMLERSGQEYEKYRDLHAETEKKQSLKEIEDDIKKLGKK
ncbi:MAG: virulence RhuM family protein, partial [Treponema sp.]|nr:virulence RhuM family protein [Treponema sp.]